MATDTLLSTSVSLSALHAEILFFERFAQLMASDVPLLRAIEIAAGELADNELKNVIHTIKLWLEQGESLGDAFRRYPNFFSKFAIAIIDSGEREGRLDENLFKLAESLRREIQSRKETETNLVPSPVSQSSSLAMHLDEISLNAIANRFAESFVNAIEQSLTQKRQKETRDEEIIKIVCPRCRNKIKTHLRNAKRSGRKTTKKRQNRE